MEAPGQRWSLYAVLLPEQLLIVFAPHMKHKSCPGYGPSHWLGGKQEEGPGLASLPGPGDLSESLAGTKN